MGEDANWALFGATVAGVAAVVVSAWLARMVGFRGAGGFAVPLLVGVAVAAVVVARF